MLQKLNFAARNAKGTDACRQKMEKLARSLGGARDTVPVLRAFLKSRVAPLLALLALTSVGLWAQSTQGGLHGAITDASGAAVPNAKVTLTNVGTNEVRNTTT